MTELEQKHIDNLSRKKFSDYVREYYGFHIRPSLSKTKMVELFEETEKTALKELPFEKEDREDLIVPDTEVVIDEPSVDEIADVPDIPKDKKPFDPFAHIDSEIEDPEIVDEPEKIEELDFEVVVEHGVGEDAVEHLIDELEQESVGDSQLDESQPVESGAETTKSLFEKYGISSNFQPTFQKQFWVDRQLNDWYANISFYVTDELSAMKKGKDFSKVPNQLKPYIKSVIYYAVKEGKVTIRESRNSQFITYFREEF